jgi:methionyl-tRNA formyltransferase
VSGTAPGPRLRVALFGSPAFALASLDALAERHRLELVVAQPDKRAGRGMRRSSPPTVERARALGVPVLQPARLKGNEEIAERLQGFDAAVTAAYGKILPAQLLRVPRHGFLNVHASLLPAYRGAAPVQWALIRGEHETGITIMQTEAGLDTGPIRLQRRQPIAPDVTAPELLGTLAELGARALLEALDLLADDHLPCEPQDDARASHAPMLTKEDGRIRWDDPADAVYARHRGVAGWPGSTFVLDGETVKVAALRPAPHDAGGDPDAAPGTVLALSRDGLRVACGAGAIDLQQVQSPGRRPLPARDWANGRRLRPGVRLG